MERPSEKLVLGYHDVEVHVVDAAGTELCARLRDTLPPGDPFPGVPEPASVSYSLVAGTSAGTGEPLRYALSRDGVGVLPSATEEEVLRWLWNDIIRILTERGTQLAFVHAGVLGWRGIAI